MCRRPGYSRMTGRQAQTRRPDTREAPGGARRQRRAHLRPGRCPETKGGLTFGKPAEQAVRVFSRTFPGKYPSHTPHFKCQMRRQSVPPYVRFSIASLLEPHIPFARLRLRIWDLADPSLFCPRELVRAADRDLRGVSGRLLLGISRPQRRGRSALPSVSAKLKPVGNHPHPLGFNLMYHSEAPSNGG